MTIIHPEELLNNENKELGHICKNMKTRTDFLWIQKFAIPRLRTLFQIHTNTSALHTTLSMKMSFFLDYYFVFNWRK